MVKNILNTIKNPNIYYDGIVLNTIKKAREYINISDQVVARMLLCGHIQHPSDDKQVVVFVLSSLLEELEKREEYEACEIVKNELKNLR